MELNKSSLDETRIVSTKEAYESLICMICLNLSYNPLLINCCESITCKSCIEDCLKKNNRCPKCRHENPKKEIPNKFIMRLFTTLRIKCMFEDKGCTEVITYESLENHEKRCQFNPYRKINCDKCSTEITLSNKDSHDCTKELQTIISNLNQRIKELTVENESYKMKASLSNNSLNQIPNHLVDKVEEAVSNIKVHPKHFMIRTSHRINANCDICRIGIGRNESFCCYECDFDLCLKCHLYIKFKVEDNKGHPHNLILLRHLNLPWICDNCNKGFSLKTWSWRCANCNFDLCFVCRFKDR